jgi:hypothetical protein
MKLYTWDGLIESFMYTKFRGKTQKYDFFLKTWVEKLEFSKSQYLDQTWRRTEIFCGFATLSNLYIWAQYEGYEADYRGILRR